MSFAYLYVPNEFEKEARKALEELDKANDEEGEDS
jgi:hypothetical protein